MRPTACEVSLAAVEQRLGDGIDDDDDDEDEDEDDGDDDEAGSKRVLEVIGLLDRRPGLVTPSISQMFVPIATRSPRGYVELRASRDRRRTIRGCFKLECGD